MMLHAGGTLGPPMMVLFALILTVNTRLCPLFRCYAVNATVGANVGATQLAALVPILMTLVVCWTPARFF